ncbi:MAG: hypothetical protein J6X60_11745 [Ruminiclostridium sp.]|nr:hypothetical protein [Ruminiclostridium sp.]
MIYSKSGIIHAEKQKLRHTGNGNYDSGVRAGKVTCCISYAEKNAPPVL